MDIEAHNLHKLVLDKESQVPFKHYCSTEAFQTVKLIAFPFVDILHEYSQDLLQNSVRKMHQEHQSLPASDKKKIKNIFMLYKYYGYYFM